MTGRRIVLGVGAVALVACSVVVFLAFDGRSHSASDTLRPFVLTMGPVWLAAAAAWWWIGRARR